MRYNSFMSRGGFTGSRYSGGGMSEAARLKRMELMKGGKLPISSADRYRMAMKKKLEEAKQKTSDRPSFQLPGTATPPASDPRKRKKP